MVGTFKPMYITKLYRRLKEQRGIFDSLWAAAWASSPFPRSYRPYHSDPRVYREAWMARSLGYQVTPSHWWNYRSAPTGWIPSSEIYLPRRVAAVVYTMGIRVIGASLLI